jgi:NitT/TauT family transport system substrate-binding protein
VRFTTIRRAKVYAAYGKVSEKLARRIRDEFLPKAALQPDRVLGLDQIMRDAIEFKFMTASLSNEQLAAAIQIPARK